MPEDERLNWRAERANMGAMARGRSIAAWMGAIAAVVACNDLSGINDVAFGAGVRLPAGCGPAGGLFKCNPLTNEGCDATRKDACDWGEDDPTAFQCYPGPNEALEGSACDDDNGPYCAGGVTCEDDARCHRFCCSDQDCGDAKQKCYPYFPSFGTFGLCWAD